MRLHLQNIIKDILFEKLPVAWQPSNFERFSEDKTLFSFQRRGLENASKCLYLYFKEMKGDKRKLFGRYRANGFVENFDYDPNKKESRKTAAYLLEYDKDYPVLNSRISFEHFINRMSFWMATGSGKTLIIIKLIELLGRLIAVEELPERDILFLAHRDDLLEQFKKHVEEFNSLDFNTSINIESLIDYDRVKNENKLKLVKNEITVFFYRSDLISDEHKEKLVDFKNYDNNGKWYILLDEAHKGDKEESKRQILYSILSRNGYLFNFSATFTDPRDFATCVFDFNLSKYVEDGYGKHIYVSNTEISAFRDKRDFSPIEKQKVVLKTLLLLTYINKQFEKIRKKNKELYHKPLLLTLVNSVDTKKSDMELFFTEIEKIAGKEIREGLLEEARKELIDEFSRDINLEFENSASVIDTEALSRLDYEEILKHVLNAKKPGSIEVLKIPGNKKELIFKLKTTEKPFALIKIGDISGWLKDKLNKYEINESFENKSYFEQISGDDSDINLLIGSRAFYEGWDSNRPNILLFINIGVGKQAKKFVLQSVGRGVRIEPFKHKRRRLQNLLNGGEIKEEVFHDIENLIKPLESLFIFGTDANNLKEIIAALNTEKRYENLGKEFILNPETKGKILLIPVYRDSEKICADVQKYPISRGDFEAVKRYFEVLGDKVALVKYDCEVEILEKVNKSFQKEEFYYGIDRANSILNPELILGRIFDYFGIKSKEVDKMKELENEIVHFKKIKFGGGGEKYERLLKAVKRVKNYPEKKIKEEEIDKEFYRTKDLNKHKKSIRQLDLDFAEEVDFDKLKIKYIQNHYYLPVVVSEGEKIDYINHIIDVPSEVAFVEELVEYLKKSDNIFLQFDWWMFSKIDHTLDEISIPYYDSPRNRIADFKPDFIFWAQKEKKYFMLFIDPKGTEYTDGYRKIDGYSRMFENDGEKISRDFRYEEFIVKTKLLFKAEQGISDVPKAYRRYWFDSFADFGVKIENFIKEI